MNGVWEFIALLGSLFIFLGTLAVLRFPDVYMRTTGAAKAPTLGMGLLLLSLCLRSGEPAVIVKCMLIYLFLQITVPLAAHSVGRAAYLTGAPRWKKTGVDELREQYDEVNRTTTRQ